MTANPPSPSSAADITAEADALLAQLDAAGVEDADLRNDLGVAGMFVKLTDDLRQRVADALDAAATRQLVDVLLRAADDAGVTDCEMVDDLGYDRAELAALSFAGGPEPAGLRLAAVAAIDSWNNGQRVHKKQGQGTASPPASPPAPAVAASAPTSASAPSPVGPPVASLLQPAPAPAPGKPIAPTVLPANIPPEHRAGPYWVMWAFTWTGKKWTKPPRPRNGQLASSTVPSIRT